MADNIKPSATVYLASFGALLGAVSMGLALGYTTPAFLDMEREMNQTNSILDPKNAESQKAVVGSMLAVGALVGGFLGEPSNKMFGRKYSLVLFSIPFIAGWLSLAFAQNLGWYGWLVIGRLLTGLGCGLVSGTAPTYVVEIAPPKIRGLLGTCFQVMVVIGILGVAVFGLFLNWRALAGVSLIASVGMSLIMLFMPETPQWLLSKDRKEEAEASLAKLRTSSVNEEFNTMQQAAANAAAGGGSQYSIALIKSPDFYKPLVLALGLMFFQQFSGINAVLFYQGDIFKRAAPGSDALQSTIWVCLAQVIATVVGSVLVDKTGRRALLLASGVGHTLALVVFGTYSYMSDSDSSIQEKYAWISLISLIFFISSFSVGYGPIPWMMIPELSSARVRSLVASIATFFNWTCVYIVTATVKQLIDSLGNAGTYWIFASICALSCVFVFVLLPETKGKSSDQIQLELLGESQAPLTGQQHGQSEQPMKTMA